MVTAVNPITGNLLRSKSSNPVYREGWERTFNSEVKSKGSANAPDPELKEMWGKWCKENLKKVDVLPSFEEWKEKYNAL